MFIIPKRVETDTGGFPFREVHTTIYFTIGMRILSDRDLLRDTS